MSLKGNSPEERVWNFLKDKGLSNYACAGFLGNFYAESGVIFNRVEILCLNRLKQIGKTYTNETYTQAVDDGTISRSEFLNPIAGLRYGYGLYQLTYESRKAGLYDLCKKRGVSIADEQATLDYLWKELNGDYSSVLSAVKNATNVKDATTIVLEKFEQPPDSLSLIMQRTKYAQTYYDKYATTTSSQTSSTSTSTNSTVTKSSAINEFIAIAENEVGYLEKASNSQLDDKTANAGSANYTKYWRDVYPSYQGQAWCACFVSWCLMKAFGKDIAEKLLKHWPYVYCPTMASLFTLNANPTVGDIVIFYRNGTFAHTGIVTSVNGDQFNTIEGNTSSSSEVVANGGGVYKKSYYNSNLPMTKFCTLDWSVVTNINTMTFTSSSTSTSTVTQNSKKYIIKGDTGDAVKELQKMLISLGYSCGDAGADGEFGELTEKALKQFQSDNGLEVDGIYGTLSKAKMTSLVSSSSKSGFATTSANDIDTATHFDANIAGTYKPITSVWLRKGAGKNKSAIKVLNENDTFRCYGYYSFDGSNPWYYGVCGSQLGFVSSKYISKI